MDRILADKLEHDVNFQRKLAKLVSSYIDAGTKTLNYYIDEFDSAHDVFNCYARLTREDLEKLDRGHPRRFIMPMTATQITTMATFIAQVLYGSQSPHSVDARHEADEQIADLVNQLLIWNATQQPTYLIGFLWIQDIITYNRGVMYEEWQPIEEMDFVEVEAEDTTADPIEEPEMEDILDEQTGEPTGEQQPTFDYEPALNAAGFQDSDPTTGEPKVNAIARMTSRQPTYKKFKKQKKETGGFVKFYIVSPYDFICDPMMPLYRQDEMRYMGHRTMIPWMELYERSRLPVDDMRYVSPTAIERLKKKARNNAVIPSEMTQAGFSAAGFMSRTRYERTRSVVPGNAIVADNKDGGVVDVMNLWIKLIPEQYGFDDSSDVEFYNILVGNGKEVLAINQGPYKHDQFPYAVGEGRPSAHYQFSPGWPTIIRGLQDLGDYLNDKHQEALARTTGNMFIYNPRLVDFEDFMDPNKIGLGISLKPESADEVQDIRNAIMQVPLQDFTKNFYNEMVQMFEIAETTTAANSAMQGEPDDKSPASTSASAQQMAAGRLTSIARMIYMQAIGPQTVRVTKDFQQFMTDGTVIRIRGDDAEYRPEFKDKKSVTLNRDMIQLQFDVAPHDGTMPGVNAKAVAAGTRLLEAAGTSPMVQALFAPGVPGNLDAKALVLWIARQSGMPVDNFIISQEGAMQNQGNQAVAGQPPVPAGQPQPPAPNISLSGDRTQVGGGLSLPNATPSSIPTASPPQIRPENS
jgi:hypothetical protein